MGHREWSDLVLGEDDVSHAIERTDDLRRAVTALAGQARRQLDILTPDLEPAIYDDAEFLAALRQLAIASPRTQLRILVGDSEQAVKRGHRLIELARRLSTAIDIHCPSPATELGTEAFLLADDRGVMWRANAERSQGRVCFNDPMSVRRLRSRFDDLWQEAQPDPELRRLHL